MKPTKLTCPHAKYDGQMHIQCDKTGEQCAHQRWCEGKGWCVLTDQAGDCPARKETAAMPEKNKQGTKSK